MTYQCPKCDRHSAVSYHALSGHYLCLYYDCVAAFYPFNLSPTKPFSPREFTDKQIQEFLDTFKIAEKSVK